MDSLLSASSSQAGSINLVKASFQTPKYQADVMILSASFSSSDGVSVDVGLGDLYKSLTVTGRNIIDKLNEMLKESLPGGIQSLKPEDTTPEATADRIASGITGLFEAFAKQHSDLEGEDLVKAFMEQARSGVEQGYGDAVKTLDNLGAFSFDGVKDGIEKTKALIEEKLKKFEQFKLEELGASSVQGQAAAPVTSQLLAEGGAKVLNTVA